MNDVVHTLVAHSISPTHQRVQIAAVLLSKMQHLSADQVMHIVNRESNVVSKATVYNTLGLFARKGLVREVIIDPSKVFYDSNTSSHHHFYNTSSGELTDIDASQLVISQLPEPPQGTEREGVDVIIRVRPSDE